MKILWGDYTSYFTQDEIDVEGYGDISYGDHGFLDKYEGWSHSNLMTADMNHVISIKGLFNLLI